jgi:hypothetical protein
VKYNFLPPSLPEISCPTKGTATGTDVAFYFMPGAEQWYMYIPRSVAICEINEKYHRATFQLQEAEEKFGLCVN